MSLESAIDEERREILKLLESNPQQQQHLPQHHQRRPKRGSLSLGPSSALQYGSSGAARAHSPLGSTRSPVRSMLDIDSEPPRPRKLSGAAQTAPATPASPAFPASPLPPASAPLQSYGESVRSLLDTSVGPPPPPPASLLSREVNSANTSPTTRGPASDVTTPTNTTAASASSSPSSPLPAAGGIHRHASDAAAHPPKGIARLLRRGNRASVAAAPSPHSDYQFAMSPANPLPKRGRSSGPHHASDSTSSAASGSSGGGHGLGLSSLGGSSSSGGSGMSSILPKSMARVMQTFDHRSGLERGRNTVERGSLMGASGSGSGSGAAGGGSSSRSPSAASFAGVGGDGSSSVASGRADSPHTARWNTSSFNNLPLGPNKILSDHGEIIDVSTAYQRLSDANLARSGGSLSSLPIRSAQAAGDNDSSRSDGDDSIDARLHKDYPDSVRSMGGGGGDGDGDGDGDDEEAVIVEEDMEEGEGGVAEDEDDEDAQGDSSYENSGDSSGGEWDAAEDGRGRKGPRSSLKLAAIGAGEGTGSSGLVGGGGGGVGTESDRLGSMLGMFGRGKTKAPSKAMSLLAAAEEEREQVSFQHEQLLLQQQQQQQHQHHQLQLQQQQLQIQLLQHPQPQPQQHQHSHHQHVVSLLPPLTLTGPGGERLAMGGASPTVPKKDTVHPTTSFDASASTPATSDTEAELSDSRRAARMKISVSPIASTAEAHRSIRTVVRGEFARLQQEAEEGARRHARTYLVATDLSDEAEYALEWTIGTILRDGDTLLAVYAIGEEGKGGGGGGSSSSGGGGAGGGGGGVDGEAGQVLAIGEGALALKDQAAIVRSLTSRAQSLAHGGGGGGGGGGGSGTSLSPSSAMATGSPGGASTAGGDASGGGGGGGGGSPRGRGAGPGGGGAGRGNTTPTSGSSPDTRNMPRAERERMRATDDITERCVKLLRKTRLQVRVVVEVIHCKSPKHLITEVIDFISPTLVILGSRGRSALKGVLLGSFSNYLVTKSSVPVMVARKRLRKHSKFRKRRAGLVGGGSSGSGGSSNAHSASSILGSVVGGGGGGGHHLLSASAMSNLSNNEDGHGGLVDASHVRQANNFVVAPPTPHRGLLAAAKVD